VVGGLIENAGKRSENKEIGKQGNRAKRRMEHNGCEGGRYGIRGKKPILTIQHGIDKDR
jgi:hypothetical protein